MAKLIDTFADRVAAGRDTYADQVSPGRDPGRPLRVVRAERLFSIRELARAASLAPSTIYLIESGRSVPRFTAIRRISAALQVVPDDVAEFRRAIGAYDRPSSAASRRG